MATPDAKINSTTVQWKRLILSVSTCLVAVAVLTPLLGALLSTAPRKTSHLIIVISFLLSLALWGCRNKKSLILDTAMVFENQPWRSWVKGFVLGVGSLLAFSMVLLLLGERVIDGPKTTASLIVAMIKYIPLAFVIGILEDVLFFGLLYATLGQRLLPSVTCYAVMHFIHIPKRTLWSDNQWTHGVEALGHMAANLMHAVDRPVELFGLGIVGWVLCSLRKKSGAIWLSMGLHGGWYWQRTIGRKWSEDAPNGQHEWLFGTDRFYDGILGWLVLLASGIILMRSTAQPPHDGDRQGNHHQ